jgi:hypothetical protein
VLLQEINFMHVFICRDNFSKLFISGNADTV